MIAPEIALAVRHAGEIESDTLQPLMRGGFRIGEDGSEILALFNTSTAPVVAQVEVEPGSPAALPAASDRPAHDRPGSHV